MPTVEIHKASPKPGLTMPADSGRATDVSPATVAALAEVATDCRDPGPERREGETAANPFGVPNHLRRLSDKILAAFNHAYAAGEEEIARRLHGALVAAERQASAQNPERRIGTTLLQAELWVGYIEARNRYLGMAQDSATEPRMLSTVEREMRAAYRQWSEM
jgi:hypothetical protein